MKLINRIATALCLVTMVFSLTSCLKDDPVVEWDQMKSVIELPYNRHYLSYSKLVPGDIQPFDLMVNYTIPYASDNYEDIVVNLGVDESLVDEYNSTLSSHSKKYVLLPSSACNLPSQITILKGTRLWKQEIQVDTKDLEPGVYYLLPIVIKSVPEPYIISGNYGHLFVRIKMQ